MKEMANNQTFDKVLGMPELMHYIDQVMMVTMMMMMTDTW